MRSEADTTTPTVRQILRDQQWRRALPAIAAVASAFGCVIPPIQTGDGVDEEWAALAADVERSG